MSFLLAQPYSPPILQNFVIGVSQLLRIVTAVLFFWSADLYRQTQYVRKIPWKWAAGVAAWFVLSLVAYLLIGIETRGRTIEELDASFARPRAAAE